MNRYALFNKDASLLKDTKVAIIGLGGIGSHVVQTLARLQIPIIAYDRDIVEESNLDRQTLYTQEDVGQKKADVCARKLSTFTTIKTYAMHIDAESIDIIDHMPDLIIDCSDNMQTRLLINDYAMMHHIPFISTAAIENSGTLLFVSTKKEDPCYACIFDHKYGSTCSQVGVTPWIVSIVANIAVEMACEYLSTKTYPCDLLHISKYAISRLKVHKNSSCNACNETYVHMLSNSWIKFCSGQYHRFLNKDIDLHVIYNRLITQGIVCERRTDRIISQDIQVFSYGRIIIKANSQDHAQKLFDEVIGL